MGVAGDPDITGCIGGQHFEFEVKRPGEQPTPLQARRLREWTRAGALAARGCVIDADQSAGVLLGLPERNGALNKGVCKRRKPEIPQADLGATKRNPMVPLAPPPDRLRNGEFAAARTRAQVLAEKRGSRARRPTQENRAV
jgi:hypothetical protein